MLQGKKILLGVSGSIAAYKAALLVRLLVKEGAQVKVIMTPAAYHRQAEPRHVSLTFVRVCTWLLVASMVPLAIAITLEFNIVADVLWQDGPVAALSLAMLLLFLGLWGVLPRVLLARERAGRAVREDDGRTRPAA